MESGRRLRPMGVGDILDETVRLFRTDFRLFVGIAAVFLLPLAILQVAQMAIVGPTLINLPRIADAVTPSDVPIGMILFWFLSSLALGLVWFIVYLVASAAFTHAASERLLGREIGIGAACRAALARFWALFGAALLAGVLCVLMGMTLIGIPFAVYFTIRWSMFIPAIVLDRAGARGALTRSSTLAKGSWWRVLGVIILASIIQYLLAGVPTYIISAVIGIVGAMVTPEQVYWTTALGAAIGIVIFALTSPITPIIEALLYYDLRIRKEGYDLQLLATPPGH